MGHVCSRLHDMGYLTHFCSIWQLCVWCTCRTVAGIRTWNASHAVLQETCLNQGRHAGNTAFVCEEVCSVTLPQLSAHTVPTCS